MTEEATNKARIYIYSSNFDQTEELSLSVEDKERTAEDLMDYLMTVAEKYEKNVN